MGLRLIGLLGVAVAMGCGLRSDPIFTVDTDFGSADGNSDGPPVDGGVEGRKGSCTNPFMLPFQDGVARGTLSGGSLYTGWCGRDEGPEDVYRVTPSVNTDMTIALLESDTDFRPTLRVQEAGCVTNEGTTVMCATRTEGTARHFFAKQGIEYNVIVDSDEGDSGDYAFDVRLGPPPLAQCAPHDETIFQQTSGNFQWFNEFSGGQGRVDSFCGAPGRENMFGLFIEFPGTIFITAVGQGGFRPVISVRSGCGVVTERGCATDETNPGTTSLTQSFDMPGMFYLAVDGATTDGGSYDLTVSFE